MIVIERTMDISKPIQTETLRGNEFKLEANAHTFRISVANNGAAVALTGSVSASMLLADGSGLTLGGSLDNGVAVLTLPQAAYGVPGRFMLAIYSVQTGATEAETVKTCIYACVGAVINTYGDQQYDPGNLIPDAETLAAYIEACQNATTAANTAAGRAETAALTAVTYAEQTGKTDAEKAQARTNIGAASEAVETAMAEHFPATGKLVAGISTTASANGAVATGVSTTASGRASHAEGQLTTADGQVAHAEGYGTTASGDYSHAEGFGTKASGDHQHAFGKYNVEDTNDTYLELAGNGTDDNARSNARTLDWNGNEALAGDLTVNKGTASEMAVGAEVSSLKSAFSDTVGIYDITLQDNKSIANGGASSVVIPSNIQTESGYACCCIPCNEGDTFTLNGRGGNSTRLWSFSDSSGAVLSISDRAADASRLEIVAPEGAAYLATNFNKHYTPYWAKKGTYTDKTLSKTGKPADAKATGDAVANVNSSLDYLADSEIKLIYPTWESGGIDATTGDDRSVNYTRTAGYIEKSKIALWNVQAHSGALYVYRYSYDDTTSTYTFLGANQIVSSGDFTSWLLGLKGTHFRFEVEVANATPDDWMTICYKSQIGEDIESLKATQTKADTIESNLGYWRQYLEIPAGSSHSSSADLLTVDIKAGQTFMIRFTKNVAYGAQIYAFYSDGTGERIASLSETYYPYIRSLFHFTASKDIVSISQYIASGNSLRTCLTEVILDDSISNLIDYSKAAMTAPRIVMPFETIYFETGRARYDVNNIHQSIAVWNNQVWEFGEGKAAYNGVVYELENGHGNTCNWGITLHGDYPYLYCPTWANNETKINVFTFDGTAFTLDHVINLNLTGYMDAYVDEFSERIYAFTYTNNRTGVITFTIADLSGTTISTKEIAYRIPVIQGMCLHNGILYVTSGFATQEFPNYLNLISTDGTLLARYPMYNIGEIEGIDFMDNEMILASYYAFYIHPTKLPNPFRTTGVFDQLIASD